MANFSAYKKGLPESLNPLSLQHCFLLTYWVYFRPTLLKCYLYQLNPDFYCAEPSSKIFRTFLMRGHRNLYLTALSSSLLISSILSFLGLLILPATPWKTEVEPINFYYFLRWIAGLVTGTVLGTVLFIVFFSVFGLVVSIARGMVSGLVVGVAASVAIGTLLSIGFVMSKNLVYNSPEITLLISSIMFVTIIILNNSLGKISKKLVLIAGVASTVTGLISGFIFDTAVTAFNNPNTGKITVILALWFGLAIGVLVSVAIGGITGAFVGGVLSGTTAIFTGVVFSVVEALMYGTSEEVEVKATGILLGFSVGMAASAANGAAVSLSRGIIASTSVCIALGITVSWSPQSDWWFGVLAGTVATAWALRIPFYIVEIILAINSIVFNKKHPCEWDDIFIFPLPGTQKKLVNYLNKNEEQGLILLFNLVCNPFQRWVAQKGFKAYLNQQRAPLHSLYALLESPVGNSYIFAPVTSQGWQGLPTVKQVILGELNGQWVDCTTDSTSRLFEHFIYFLTSRLRDHRSTPITDLAGLLFQLLNTERLETETLSLFLSSDHYIYDHLTHYPGGEEIKHSFEIMECFLKCNQLSAIAEAIVTLPKLSSSDNAIRSSLIQALDSLNNIGREISIYLTSISRINKQNALLRANNALDLLNRDVDAKVIVPEKIIVKKIIAKWRYLVSTEGGKIGRFTILKPVSNPYIAGNPVEKDNFVGRDDIMQRIEELWNMSNQPPSIVLYGHRRMGKTSILHNLKAHIEKHITIINFNLQLVGNVQNTGELIYALAAEIYDSLSIEKKQKFPEPDINIFVTYNPYQNFVQLIKRLDKVRNEQIFVIAIDEFELLEELIENRVVKKNIITFWRGLIQTYPWFLMIFAGLHTLSEMQRDYWCPFFSSVTAIPVSFLSTKAAQRLITQPSSNFELEYDSEVVQKIIDLTNGQPYLIQLIGRALVTQYNRQVFEEEQQHEKRFNLGDLESIVNSPEFYRDGDAYFAGVWRQAATSQPPGQLNILLKLCRSKLSQVQLLQENSLSIEVLQEILETLKRHDVIQEENGYYTFTVELMRLWVEKLQMTKDQ